MAVGSAIVASRDALVVPDDEGDMIRTDELTTDDRAALGWASSTDHHIVSAIIERAGNGSQGILAGELEAIHGAWNRAGRPSPPERHVHRTRVILPDGTPIIGVSFVDEDPYARDVEPSFGLYFDERWNPPWAHAHGVWPDFGVPSDTDTLRLALTDVVDRARRESAVELGCLGGHGRTGTALACLAVLAGAPADEAVAWVRANYCSKAVETEQQAKFVAAFNV